MLNPTRRLQALFLLSFLVMAYCASLSLGTRILAVDWVVQDDALYLGDTASPPIITISSANHVTTRLSALALLEEPDVLETYAEYNQFMQLQGDIAKHFAAESVVLTNIHGEQITFTVQQQSGSNLPFAFYLQMLVGLLCVAVGGSIWAFQRNSAAASVYLLMGVGVALSSWTSAVYTSRELYIDAEIFRGLSIVNHLGAVIFGAGLISIFWIYPQRIVNKPILILMVFSFVPINISDTLQLFETTAAGHHLWCLGYTLLAFVGAGVQWRKTRGAAADRAILKWMLLSVMATTLIFVSFNIIPAVFAATTLGPQALTLSGFALGFAMMALGLSRYRLFSLDSWWYQYWFWLLAGVSVVAVDILLITALGLGQGVAVAVSLLLVGWIYFPVRQWLLNKFKPAAKNSLDEVLPELASQLFSAKSQDEIHTAWQNILSSFFVPLTLHSTGNVKSAVLLDDGQQLQVPSLSAYPGWQLAYPKQGQRLFNREDVSLVGKMFDLVQAASQGIDARESGAQAERSRIKRDLHDDLGARLLSLTHSISLDNTHQQARQAIGELRFILSELEQQPCPLYEALDVWQAECRERLLSCQFELLWQQELGESAKGEVQLDSRKRHNISRVLRELISNTIKHSSGSKVTLSVAYADGQLLIDFVDDGCGASAQPRADSWGVGIVNSRIQELGGTVRWDQAAGCKVSIQLPL